MRSLSWIVTLALSIAACTKPEATKPASTPAATGTGTSAASGATGATGAAGGTGTAKTTGAAAPTGSGEVATQVGNVGVSTSAVSTDNLLVTAYPDGLNFSAFSTDTSTATSVGTVSVEGAGLSLVDLIGCLPEASTSTNGCVVQCAMGRVAPPACYCPPTGSFPNCKALCGNGITTNCVLPPGPPGPGPGPMPPTPGPGPVPGPGPSPMPPADTGGTGGTPAKMCGNLGPGVKMTPGECFASFNAYKIRFLESNQLGDAVDVLKGGTLDRAGANKRVESRDVLRGTGECFSPKLAGALKYLIETEDTLDGTPADCYQPDWGITKSLHTPTKEACMAGFGRTQIVKTTAYMDLGTGIVEALFCAAKKADAAVALPEIGAEKDLSAAFAGAISADADLAGTKAVLTRLADVEGRSIFQTILSFSKRVAGESIPFELVLTHSPIDEFKYDGTLSIQHRPVGDREACKNVTNAISIKYQRDGSEDAPLLKFEYRSARFNGSADTLFAEDGVVDFNTFDPTVVLKEGEPTSYGERFNYVTFDGDPDTGAGSLAFWVSFGKTAGDPARGFVFNVAKADDGTLSGCGAAGEAVNASGESMSIRKALFDGVAMTPTQNFRPNLCGQPQRGYIWTQCFVREEGLWNIDATKTLSDAGFDFIEGTKNVITPPDLSGIKGPPPPPADAPRPRPGKIQ